MTVTRESYAAIRRCSDPDHEYLDISSIQCLPEMTRNEVAKMASLIPGWHKANPVVRIVKVKIEEVTP